MTFDLEFEEWSGFQEIWPGQDFKKYGQGWEGSFPFEIELSLGVEVCLGKGWATASASPQEGFVNICIVALPHLSSSASSGINLCPENMAYCP